MQGFPDGRGCGDRGGVRVDMNWDLVENLCIGCEVRHAHLEVEDNFTGYGVDDAGVGALDACFDIEAVPDIGWHIL